MLRGFRRVERGPTADPALNREGLVIAIVAILAAHEFVWMRSPLRARIWMILQELMESRMILDVLAVVDQLRIRLQLLRNLGMLVEISIGIR